MESSQSSLTLWPSGYDRPTRPTQAYQTRQNRRNTSVDSSLSSPFPPPLSIPNSSYSPESISNSFLGQGLYVFFFLVFSQSSFLKSVCRACVGLACSPTICKCALLSSFPQPESVCFVGGCARGAEAFAILGECKTCAESDGCS